VVTIRAANITVESSGTYATIQAGVDAATPGDTILVQAETFNESVVISKSVTLLGGYDSTFTTRTPRTSVISPTGRALVISGTAILVTVDGFEIANGATTGTDDDAGIYVDVKNTSAIIINDNYIHNNNSAALDNRSNLQITNNVMSNTTTAGSGNDYAGIYAAVTLSGTLTITGNTIA